MNRKAAVDEAKRQVERFSMGELSVVHEQTAGELVSAVVLFRRSAEPVAGVDHLALRWAVEGGTEARDAAAFAAGLEQAGARVRVRARQDFLSVRLTCQPQHFRQAWPLLAEALTTPRFAPPQLERLRRELLEARHAQAGTAPALADSLLRHYWLAGHPYGLAPYGTAKSLQAVTPLMARARYDSLLQARRMKLIVSGNLRGDRLASALLGSFDALPPGNPSGATPPLPDTAALALSLAAPAEGRHQFRFWTAGPGPEAPSERLALAFGMKMLEDELRRELVYRSHLATHQAVRAELLPHRKSMAVISVASSLPGPVYESLTGLLERRLANGFTEAAFQAAQRSFLHDYWLREHGAPQRAEQLATAAAGGQLFDYISRPKLLAGLSRKAVNRVMRDTWAASHRIHVQGKGDYPGPPGYERLGQAQ